MSRRAWFRVRKKWPQKWSPLPTGVPRLPHPTPFHLAHVAQWFHAVSDINRLHILEFLSQRERTVTELVTVMGVSQSLMSFHLKVLKESDLVSESRDGRWRHYGLCGETMEAMTEFIRRLGPGKHVGTCPLTCCR